ncbi:MAG: glycosyltransferase family 39 protein [Vulcanimicrobiaceae bacterium]
MGLRAVGHAAQSPKVCVESFRVDRSAAVAAFLAIATFALHYIAAGRYGYQRDELYFISCAHHLAWGYVDQPPLIAVVAKVVLALFGDSLYAIRLLPALAASATVVLTGRIAARFGGGPYAQALAMIAVALAPFFLAIGSLFTMNAFEPLLWLAAVALLHRAIERDESRVWLALGTVCGLGLVNKYSTFFFLGSCLAGIALTPARRTFARPGFAFAVALASAIVAPTLVWQAQNGWPQLAVLHDAAASKNYVVGPLVFYAQQILMMNPLTAPLWIAGLVAALAGTRGGTLRWIGIAYVVLSIVYLALGAKVYYLAPVYPILFAIGAPVVAGWLERRRASVLLYPALLVVCGLLIAPEAYPLLPLPTFERYEHVLDLRGIKMEKHPEGRVPQHYADELGWHTLVAALGRANDGLSPAERRQAVILTRDYGQASAVDFFGPKRGLPRAISGHNNYFLYGPRGASGAVVLAVGFDAPRLRAEFERVERVGFFHDDYVLPDFNDLPIYKCTKPRSPLAAWWPSMRRYI